MDIYSRGEMKFLHSGSSLDRHYGIVVRVSGYRYRDPGSISGATRFSEKQWAWNGVHSAS
jgi:hypothetical protein